MLEKSEHIAIGLDGLLNGGKKVKKKVASSKHVKHSRKHIKRKTHAKAVHHTKTQGPTTRTTQGGGAQ
tara:strand:- start:711 stop:914 length:204 start_codon:yes stop_codon:yes gene_type:complete